MMTVSQELKIALLWCCLIFSLIFMVLFPSLNLRIRKREEIERPFSEHDCNNTSLLTCSM